MATVPTSTMEDELRAYYLRWLAGLDSVAEDDMQAYIDEFERNCTAIINKYGTQAVATASDPRFPPPQVIPLDVDSSDVIADVRLLAIQAGIGAGLNARDVAMQMFKQGMDAKFSNLERLARTETVHAYWNHQWKQVDGLGLVMVWSSEESKRTCPYCLAKDGLVVKQQSIRDHPNGRCTLLPTLPSDVPLRNKERNPQFTRNHKQQEYPLPQNVAFNQALRGGLDRTLIQSRAAQQAIGGMVSQGWTPAEATWYMQQFPGMDSPLSPKDKILVYRHLEKYSQQLWDALEPNALPSVLYRGGEPSPIGLSSWSANKSVATGYAVRNSGLYRMDAPTDLLGYQAIGNKGQHEYMVLGMPRVIMTEGSGKLATISGVLDGPTTLTTVEQAASTLPRKGRQR